jgi:glutamyl-tRNA synthetase
VRGNLAEFRDSLEWWAIVNGDIAPAIEDAELLGVAAEELPSEPWDAGTWGDWTARLKSRTGRKGRALYHPLRLALTGRESGPELAALLPLIGRARASFRLRALSA